MTEGNVQKVSVYDYIKMPIDTDEGILEIVRAYAKCSKNDYRDLYTNMLKDEKLENDRYFYEYLNNYNNYVVEPSIDRLYAYINNPEIISGYDHDYELIKKNNSDKYDIDEQLYRMLPLYPLSEYKEIFEHFKSYGDLKKFVEANKFYENEDLYKYSNSLWDSEKKILKEKMLRNKYTERYIEIGDLCLRFRRKMANSFSTMGIMGFHVDPFNLAPYKDGMQPKLFNDEIKLYLNAGVDTYRVAQLFQKECEKHNLVYYYKVARGDFDDEYMRRDKMCIYSTYDNLINYMSIIEGIRQKHPEIKFEKPPVSTGLINNYLGIGQDRGGRSYNGLASETYYKVLDELFKDVPKDKVVDYVKANPRYINAIRKRIKDEFKKAGLSEKACIYESEKDKVKNLFITVRKEEKKDNTKTDTSTKTSSVSNFDKDEYIRQLVLYTTSARISIYDYYASIATKYLNTHSRLLPAFEATNPYLDFNSIDSLAKTYNQEYAVKYFASQMSQFVELNLDKKKKSNGYTITSVNEELLENLDGFAIVRDAKVATYIYGYEHNNRGSLVNGTMSRTSNNLQPGYYVNVVEFVNMLKKQYSKDISFITPKNELVDFDTVMNKMLSLTHKIGLIRFGAEYSNKKIEDYDVLEKMYTGAKGSYGSLKLAKGYYVKKDILANFFGKLKIRVNSNTDTVSYHK